MSSLLSSSSNPDTSLLLGFRVHLSPQLAHYEVAFRIGLCTEDCKRPAQHLAHCGWMVMHRMVFHGRADCGSSAWLGDQEGPTCIKRGGQRACAIQACSAVAWSDAKHPTIAGRHPHRPCTHPEAWYFGGLHNLTGALHYRLDAIKPYPKTEGGGAKWFEEFHTQRTFMLYC